MRRFTLILNLCGSMLFYMHGTAQMVWNAPELTADNGELISVDLTVIGYQDLISAQGAIQFDPSVLEYSHVDNFALSSMTTNSFGETYTDGGILTFSWSEGDLIGKTIMDNDTVLTVYFNVVGVQGDSSVIALTDTITQVEFIDSGFNPVAFNSSDGKVMVNDTVAKLSIYEKQERFAIYPNPAEDVITIQGNSQGNELQVYWYSLNGELIRKEQKLVVEKGMKLTISSFNEGTYLMRLGNEKIGFENHLIHKL